MNIKLRLAHKLEDQTIALHNGPGHRWLIWMQGCSIRCCKNCLNPTMLDPDSGYEYGIDEMIQALQEVSQCRFYHAKLKKMVPVEGITLLGGEPTDQAEPLIHFCKSAQKSGMSVLLYSGLPLPELQNHSNVFVQDLLNYTDLLIDGPYKDEFYDDTLTLRGSSNQQLHILTKYYTSEDLEEAFAWQGKGVSFHYHHDDGHIAVSGIQSGVAAREFTKKMRDK